MMIAVPVTIESTRAAMVVVPHGAKLPPPPPSPAADSLAPSVNAPKHTSLNATSMLMYASLLLGKDRGRTAPMASSAGVATAVTLATSTLTAAVSLPTMTTTTPLLATPTAAATTSFVKLNFI